MPEYYSGQNNVLGGRPYAAPQGAERPNALLAVVILALCAAGVAALVALHPGVSQGGSDLREAVPYLVVEYADGNATAGTCCLLGPGGLAVTSRQMAFPRGVNDAPARYRAFLNSAQPAQQEVAVKIDAKPAGGGQGTSAEERHRHNWATLKLDAGAKALPALRADADPAKLVEGRRVWLAGYDPDGKHLELQRLEAKIAKVQKARAKHRARADLVVK